MVENTHFKNDFPLQNSRGIVQHVETRRSVDSAPSQQPLSQTIATDSSNSGGLESSNGVESPPIDVLIAMMIDTASLGSLLKALRQGTATKGIKLLPPLEDSATPSPQRRLCRGRVTGI